MKPLHAIIAAWASGLLLFLALILYAEADRHIRQRIRRKRRQGTINLEGKRL